MTNITTVSIVTNNIVSIVANIIIVGAEANVNHITVSITANIVTLSVMAIACLLAMSVLLQTTLQRDYQHSGNHYHCQLFGKY